MNSLDLFEQTIHNSEEVDHLVEQNASEVTVPSTQDRKQSMLPILPPYIQPG